MTTELEIIRTFWPIIYAVAAAALAFVAWLIRLEGKQKSNHEKIVQVEKMQETTIIPQNTLLRNGIKLPVVRMVELLQKLDIYQSWVYSNY